MIYLCESCFHMIRNNKKTCSYCGTKVKEPEAKKICDKCNKYLSASRCVCPHCNNDLTVSCPSCKILIPKNIGICPHCLVMLKEPTTKVLTRTEQKRSNLSVFFVMVLAFLFIYFVFNFDEIQEWLKIY